ncbi:ceramidase [Bacteriovoracaceae bacterium]|nr:ceramidase [Bacteriovoracaceae bacterium]
MLDFLKSPYPHSIEPHCPYYAFSEMVGGPNVKWCEQTVCGYFNEPNLTWTNLTYIFMAIFFIWHVRKIARSEFTYFAWSIFFTGLFSFIYHATNNWISQYGDFFGMYLMLSAIIGLNLSRASIITTKLTMASFYFIFVLAFTVLFFISPSINFPVQFIVVIGVIIILITEFLATKKSSEPISHVNFVTSLFFFIVAITFSILDHKRILCSPDNHWFQGHGMWHMVATVAFIFTYRHYLAIDQKYFSLK